MDRFVEDGNKEWRKERVYAMQSRKTTKQDKQE